MGKKPVVKRSRPCRIMIALTPAELQAIELKAKKVGLAASTYIRQLAIVNLNG